MRLKVNNKRLDFFNSLNITLSYASVGSTFSFTSYFRAENREQRGLFNPLSYPKVEIFDDLGNKVLTGVGVNHGFTDSSNKSVSSISGYSTPGVLEDCPIPIELYPLESNGKSLREIATALIEPFGLNLVVSSLVAERADEVYDKSIASQQQSVKSYLDELASQKNIILSHTVGGSLLLTQSRANTKPVARFVGGIPDVKMTVSTNGRRMHSSITVQKQTDLDNDNAGEETINNLFVSVFRPTTKEQSSGDDIDTIQAVRNALSNELKAIVLTIEVDRWTWEDDGKVMMTPNNVITVHNHEVHLYQFARFFVESIIFFEDAEKQSATLRCVIPAVYSDEDPVNVFIVPNNHD